MQACTASAGAGNEAAAGVTTGAEDVAVATDKARAEEHDKDDAAVVITDDATASVDSKDVADRDVNPLSSSLGGGDSSSSVKRVPRIDG